MIKNNTKYKVPRKYEKMVKEIYQDSDGIMIHLADGWFGVDETTVIFEDTWKEALEVLRLDIKKA